ncbi:MAG: FkbM family methyltransferase, partial [Anaerolineales bacterium]|nr:FkbM family methyltransferase [Anaerolineales bacterium]
ISGMGERVTIVPAAVVETPRPVRFLVGPSGGMGKAEGSAGRQDVAYAQAVEVEGISLDAFVFDQGNPPPALVKMDIEGGEVLALPGMQRVLERYKPVVLMELHGPQAAQAAWQALTLAGYRLHRMQAGYPAVRAVEDLDWKAYLVALPGEQ